MMITACNRTADDKAVHDGGVRTLCRQHEFERLSAPQRILTPKQTARAARIARLMRAKLLFAGGQSGTLMAARIAVKDCNAGKNSKPRGRRFRIRKT